jgi:outer membrane receptor protein involved in Fe transport
MPRQLQSEFHQKTKHKLFISSIISGGVGLCLLGGAAANAQTTAAAPTGSKAGAASEVQEVVVTAERRADTVKNVPMSITAISSSTIKKFDIQDFADYAKLTPNISFGMGVGGGGASFSQGVTASLGITIRGISGYDTTAFYIDDTPLPESLDPRVLDIDHIEVLRGPQGTLFGASSMGGLVRVITQPADMNKFSGTVDLQGYDMSHGGAPGGEASAVVNIPLVKDLASVRLSAFGSYTPGYFKRTYNDPLALNVTGAKVTGPAQVVNNVGASPEEGFGATFRVTPVEGLVLTPVVRWQRTSGNGFAIADYDPNNLVQRRILNQPESYHDEFFFAAFTGSYTMPLGRVVSSTSWLNRESYDLEDGADANAIFLSPNLLLPGPSYGKLHSTTFTEEDRFESNFGFPVQAVGGVFYQVVTTGYLNNVIMPGLDAEPHSPYNTDTIWNLVAKDRTTQLAGFLGLTYTPVKALQIEVGGRESVLTNATYAFSDGIFGTGLGQTKVSESAFTPRVSAKYRFTPQMMVYATAAQGFRGGGANVPLGSACGGFGFSTTEQIPYNSDDLWSYEGGVKASALDNRLSVSADVYHIDWTRIQQTEVLSNGAGGCFASLTLNLGSAASDGGELEVDARVTDSLTLHLAGGYEDARLTKVFPGTEYYVGEPLSGVPKWTTTASADYEIPQSWGNYFIRGQYSFSGGSISYTEVATGLARKAYQLVDVRAGANYHAYTVTLFAKNLFDARPNLSDEVAVSALAANRYRFSVGLPREVGVDLRFHF